MKKSIIYVLLFLTISVVYSQNYDYEELVESSDALPEIVLKKVKEEFSVYIPDRHPDSRVARLQNEFISYNLDDKIDGENTYFITFRTEGAFLAAQFNGEGKLHSVVEQYKAAKLPERVRKSLAKQFPDWQLITDKYSYIQRDGRITKKQYKVIIKKDKKIRRLVVNDEGEVLRGKV